jgi:DNA-binding NarL/FixJ family response regulator
MIKIGIAEDIEQIAQALKKKLELSPDFLVKFVARNGKLAISELQKGNQVDVLLMDINMPEMDGIEATEKIAARWPQVRIIMSTIFDDDEYLVRAIMAGAGGYLMKDESPAQVHKSIYSIMEGGAPMSPGIANKVLKLLKNGGNAAIRPAVNFDLTEREAEVLIHLSKGLSYEQIADNLFISYGTVRKHIENIYRKLRVNNKTEAINKAGRNKLL